MAEYTNSAGVKLPNADIIIEADEDGTVTSCKDVVTNTEYINQDFKVSTFTLINQKASGSASFSFATITNGALYVTYNTTIGNGQTKTVQTITPINVTSSSAWSEIIGDYEVSGSRTIFKGDVTIIFR